MSLLILDVDRFKSVNDRFGHDAGDAALREVSRILERASGGMLAARFGGEEFAVLLPNLGPREALSLAESVRVEVERAPFGHGTTTVSVGVATQTDGDAEPLDLIRRADAALYEAKRSGRNRVCEDTGAYRLVA